MANRRRSRELTASVRAPQAGRGMGTATRRARLMQELLALAIKPAPPSALSRAESLTSGLAQRGALWVLAHAEHEGLTLLLVASPRDFWERLSDREREIVRLCVEGRSAKEIAVALHLQPSTVASKLRLIYAKLGVESKAALIRSAFVHVEHELATAEESASSLPS